jgi:hypothetical protein
MTEPPFGTELNTGGQRMSKHADIEHRLRMYRDSEYKLHQLRRERKNYEELAQEITGLKAMRFSSNVRVQTGEVSDPVYATYVSEIMRYDREIVKLTECIRIMEQNCKVLELAIKQLDAMEQAIIRWKYWERWNEKYILHHMRKNFNYPAGRRQLYNLLDVIYNKLAQHCT